MEQRAQLVCLCAPWMGLCGVVVVGNVLQGAPSPEGTHSHAGLALLLPLTADALLLCPLCPPLLLQREKTMVGMSQDIPFVL